MRAMEVLDRREKLFIFIEIRMLFNDANHNAKYSYLQLYLMRLQYVGLNGQ